MRRYPRINGPAALPLFCLAPHGVFPASRIAPRAVSSYLAFSPLPALCYQRTGGIFSVALSVTALLRARRPRFLRGMPPYGVRTFLSGLLRSDHLPSTTNYRKQEEPARTVATALLVGRDAVEPLTWTDEAVGNHTWSKEVAAIRDVRCGPSTSPSAPTTLRSAIARQAASPPYQKWPSELC